MMESILCKEFNYKNAWASLENEALGGLTDLKGQEIPISADDFILQFIEETNNDESLNFKQCASPEVQEPDEQSEGHPEDFMEVDTPEILEILESY